MYRAKKLFLSSLAALLFVSIAAQEEDSKSKKDNVGTVIGIDLGTTYSWYALFAVYSPCQSG